MESERPLWETAAFAAELHRCYMRLYPAGAISNDGARGWWWDFCRGHQSLMVRVSEQASGIVVTLEAKPACQLKCKAPAEMQSSG